ncbi:MAG TPA: DUF4266 domain-containing protein [Polyangiaceae bacterium]|nr:DUF4266 domain-containing protein [Polyangiaceae bacterium]
MRESLVNLRISMGLGCVALALFASACATVRPEQRAVLADPTMRFEGEPGEKAAVEHALENREASYGGGSVRGGGCGCN